uniref:Uncharacterized protein n=1 Tax=Eutreptiella gymnastica TaxID=73025 RepID=A0A7S4G9L4_9EUGL
MQEQGFKGPSDGSQQISAQNNSWELVCVYHAVANDCQQTRVNAIVGVSRSDLPLVVRTKAGARACSCARTGTHRAQAEVTGGGFAWEKWRMGQRLLGAWKDAFETIRVHVLKNP